MRRAYIEKEEIKKLQEVVDAQIYAETEGEATIKSEPGQPFVRGFDRVLTAEEVKSRYRHMCRLMEEEG